MHATLWIWASKLRSYLMTKRLSSITNALQRVPDWIEQKDTRQFYSVDRKSSPLTAASSHAWVCFRPGLTLLDPQSGRGAAINPRSTRFAGHMGSLMRVRLVASFPRGAPYTWLLPGGDPSTNHVSERVPNYRAADMNAVPVVGGISSRLGRI
jgi:hypothetical protein